MEIIDNMENFSFLLTDKQKAELQFWKHEMIKYILWYIGEIPVLYKTSSPLPKQRKETGNIFYSAILTWTELHQKPKYLNDLNITTNHFFNKRILDVGSGPIPSAICLKDCDIYSLDPLMNKYASIGYPFDIYPNVNFINAYVENIPIEDNFFDVIISVNAIDHVDNLESASKELCRVAKDNCSFIMHVHYHKPTIYEPIEINDTIFSTVFSWVKGLRVAKRTISSFSSTTSKNEEFVLWSNLKY